MMEQEEDPRLPASILAKLYDATGTPDGNKGFLLFFINDKGQPALTSRTANSCVHIALHKTIEIYNNEQKE